MVRIVSAALAALALALPASAAAGSPAATPFRDTILKPQARSLQAAARLAGWGGLTTAADGEQVAIYFSDDYPQDPARARQWADFMVSLVHGPELQSLILQFAPLRTVQRQCGPAALACYSPSSHTILAPGDEIPGGPSLQSIVIHEYGHHVAATRANDPWDANDYGPKRWATAAGVCAKASDGRLFPGDEGRNYQLNPAEAFAESYRLLNEEKLGLPISPWDVVDPSLEPDATTLAALEQDVTSPWQTPTTRAYAGSFRKGAALRQRTYTIQTPLDGTLLTSLAQPRTGRFRLLLNGNARTTGTICGVRTVTATVKRISGYGAFRLAVSVP